MDNAWIPAGSDSRRELTAVREGKYNLRVRSVAATGAVSPETTFSFEVLPPWWRTKTASLGAGVLLVGAAALLYSIRIRSLRRRNAQLEAKVRERTEELVLANAAKTQFVANMSHDIRNPLNGIVGLALALEDSQLQGRQREIVATLRECTTYLSTLVDDVLDFASIEAGRVELRPGPFSPHELLRSIVETLKADTADCGATLTIETGPDLPPALHADAGRIQQILVNFVSNALKYAGGHIHLSATLPADAPGEIEFAVRDEGPGISAADRAALFTKFTRVKRSHGGEEIPGTGLGLASCRLLADIMVGSVDLESSPGHGARFILRLPLMIAAEPVATPASTIPNSTVLLVEDADYNAWAAEAVLARLGLTCERARTGAEALQLFEARRFNVVLLDRNLPDMDGTEVARRMRELETDGARAVLLAVTAYCTAEDKKLCLDAGMDAFVGKPLTPEKLRKVFLTEGRRLLTAASVQVRAPATAPAPTPAPEPDLKLLTYLSNGTEAGLEAQIERFISALDDSERQLMASASARDFESVASGAHHILGEARMVGFAPLEDVTARLEAAARSQDAAALADGVTRVAAEIQALKAAMRRRRPSALSV